MSSFISWCNENSGFFSLVLSMVAIAVSVYAINTQNKGVVFEKRLSIYCTVDKIYQQSCRIVEICSGKTLAQQRKLIAAIIFDIDSKEKEIIRKVSALEAACTEEKANHSHEIEALVDEYTELYIKKYLYNATVDEAKIFYNSEISDCIKKLFDLYDDLRLGILSCSQEDVNRIIKSLEDTTKSFDQNHILTRMKQKLPI
jgi:hypothetical protein